MSISIKLGRVVLYLPRNRSPITQHPGNHHALGPPPDNSGPARLSTTPTLLCINQPIN